MYISRNIENKIKSIDKSFPALIITGPRQVGKTSVLKHCMKNDRQYITFDDLVIRQQFKNDPALFLQKYKGKLLIDEIQYIPEILSYLKMDIDSNKEYGKFWLTGSQQFHLMKNVSESLAGRIIVLHMQGLSQSEKFNTNNKPFLPQEQYNIKHSLELKELYKIIWLGSFPELYSNKNINPADFYSSYLRTYIERDVKDLLSISNENTFLKFIQITASRTGQLLNYNDIANNVGISIPTIKNWLSILESSGIIYMLQPYYNNITTRIIKTPKLYFLDTGLCSYLTGCYTSDLLEKGIMGGAIFETYVVSEILKSYWNNGIEPRIYFYRDNNQKEVDILIEENGKIYPVEIKKTASPSKNDIRHFSVLEKLDKEISTGAVISLYKDWFPINDKINAVNIGVI